MKVAVIFGGKTAERDVSLKSGALVLGALRARGVDAHAFDPAEKGLEALIAGRYERAFIALHGRFGEDGTLQGALEWLGIPYTGSGVLASALAMDKLRTKLLWHAEGLPTPPYEVLGKESNLEAVAKRLRTPLFVKPASEGSSVGMTKVRAAAGLDEAYALAVNYDPVVIAEKFIDGPELTAAILGDDVLPVIRIETPREFYDYEAKYAAGGSTHILPAALKPAQADRAMKLSLEAHRVLGCRGVSRADLRFNGDEFYMLEVNTQPGMTGTSLVPELAAHSGRSFGELVKWIVEDASCNR